MSVNTNAASPRSRVKAWQASPTLAKPPADADVSVRHILERYRDDPELLKHILMAKMEEDKKIAAQDTLKTEQARVQLRELDMDLMREHSKATLRYYDKHYAPAVPTTQHTAQPYYGLAPVQQQVLARITSDNGSSDPYPHSAHPLCPPADNPYRRNRLYPGHQPATPISPGAIDEAGRKRGRASVNEEGSLSHVQVMEALKAKIQRGSGSGTPTDAQADRSKRPRTKPVEQDAIPPSTPSPRSAKPILPPIDTSVGRSPGQPDHRYDTPRHTITSPAEHALREPVRRTEKHSAHPPPSSSSPSSSETTASSS
ncbi:hypothetical protein BJV82DRAFT_602820 [Fennellomyces sp. T-0311]|nr:hypothetical protein BJV82DRAFT_602820 [Fennellomyces sp. T-0311]